jgi:hypothetical protein
MLCMAPRKTSCCTACPRDEFGNQYVSDTDKRCKSRDVICYILLKLVELNFHFHPAGSALYVGTHVQIIQCY